MYIQLYVYRETTGGGFPAAINKMAICVIFAVLAILVCVCVVVVRALRHHQHFFRRAKRFVQFYLYVKQTHPIYAAIWRQVYIYACGAVCVGRRRRNTHTHVRAKGRNEHFNCGYATIKQIVHKKI